MDGMKDKVTLSKGALALLLSPTWIPAWVVPSVLLRAWVITMMWGWYVTPAFGLPPLRLAFAFGLSVFAGMFRASYAGKDDRKISGIIAGSFVNPLMTLFIGWVGSLFV